MNSIRDCFLCNKILACCNELPDLSFSVMSDNKPEALHPGAIQLLMDEHIADLAVCIDHNPWSFSCFYAFDPELNFIIFKSNNESYHSTHTKGESMISGCVRNSTLNVHQIQGVQFTGQIYRLPANENLLSKSDQFPSIPGLKNALVRAYKMRFPFAENFPGNYWVIRLEMIKFTDNSIEFGFKSIWESNRQ